MYTLIFGFLSSLILTLALVRYSHLHSRFSDDNQLAGPQKFHVIPVPRIGGLGIFISLCIASFVRALQNLDDGFLLFTAIACSFPAFAIGITEDISKKIRVLTRLFVVAIGALLAIYFLGIRITNLDMLFIDSAIALPVISIIFTCFAITGLANAYNIIDGFNGLASMVGIISLMAIAYVAFRVGDIPMVIMPLALIGSIAGFFVWNYPRGLIFLGDGGAYLIGFWIAISSILIIDRNQQISPWFALIINAYPVFETLFTIWRRKVHQGKSPGIPDAAHFHSLIYRRLLRWAHAPLQLQVEKEPTFSTNAKTSPYLWLLSSLAIMPGVLWWNSTWVLQLSFIIFCINYWWIYKSIVRFKTPKWLKGKS
ncbi:glycosyltransferase [Polynucleobacter sp. AP-Sanab-80-C2]|uniref:glycosyltransferase family 4 protein n=1 Tax=Polynucleobacter sp. AP-Sanab-80-C2 TaxID=3108274 RepID=UPI002B22C7E6|nr:glycosyltransferase [Polynucleobacter sp. AP-Sanab-80-C2]MEA9598539.1 glycosyltransferase [Polynucleobacter sp. AP-Sanab-80-C2]